MSELDICSRRQADRFIMEGRVVLNGNPVAPILGQKVPPGEQNIVLMSQNMNIHSNSNSKSTGNNENISEVQRRPMEFDWDELQTSVVVLHKPVGFISGVFDQRDSRGGDESSAASNNNRNSPQPQMQQPQMSQIMSQTQSLPEQKIPAVRLLSPDNAHIVPSNYYDYQDQCVNEAEYQEANNIVDHRLDFQVYRASNVNTLQRYVPAGRLDMNSAGLLVFTRHGGVMAKKLVSPHGLIEKEYLVVVEPLQGLTHREREAGMPLHRLPPKPTKNLSKFKRGGHRLWGEEHLPPLRPVVAAEWVRWSEGEAGIVSHNDQLMQTYLSIEEDLYPNERRRILRIVLKEGRKHQVRRMCRELLGMHVVKLVRTRVGPIELDSLPEGKWRPLRQHEAEAIYTAS